MPKLPRVLLGLKTSIFSAGVVAVWAWCVVVAAIFPLSLLVGQRPCCSASNAVVATVITAAVAAFTYFYPRFLTVKYRQLTGRDPWFRHPMRAARAVALRAIGRRTAAERAAVDIATADGETRAE